MFTEDPELMEDYVKYRDRDKSRDRGRERDRKEDERRSVSSLIDTFEREDRRSGSREKYGDTNHEEHRDNGVGGSPFNYLREGGRSKEAGFRDRDLDGRDRDRGQQVCMAGKMMTNDENVLFVFVVIIYVLYQ